jgi:regulator of protease activity HflC (stomatin/prohibitin superfamily)
MSPRRLGKQEGKSVDVLLIGLVVLVLVLLLARATLDVVTVFEYQRGLKFVNGRFTGVAEPGRHWLWRPSQQIQVVDTREAVLQMPGQEVVTADGISVKLTLGIRYRIADPVTAITKVEDVRTASYLLLQVALREVVASMAIDDLLAHRDTIGPAVQERCSESVIAIGMELVSVQVRDLMFPGPLKRVFAQVTDARQQGLAALEKARGETAALRSLANAARLVDQSPSLLQLRTLQQLAGSSGNTVIVGLPPSSTPVPVRHSAEPRLPGPQEPTDSEVE